MPITIKGSLLHGVEIDKVTHRNFEIREATIRDAITALDKMMVADENLNSGYTVLMYKAAEQMVSLGDLPKEEITGKLLLDLPEPDFNVILKAQDDVEKKRFDINKPSKALPK